MDVRLFKNRELIATIPSENLVSACNYSNSTIAVNYEDNNNPNNIIICDVIYFK